MQTETHERELRLPLGSLHFIYTEKCNEIQRKYSLTVCAGVGVSAGMERFSEEPALHLYSGALQCCDGGAGL